MKWLINNFDKEMEIKEESIEKMVAIFKPWGVPDDEDGARYAWGKLERIDGFRFDFYL